MRLQNDRKMNPIRSNDRLCVARKAGGQPYGGVGRLMHHCHERSNGGRGDVTHQGLQSQLRFILAGCRWRIVHRFRSVASGALLAAGAGGGAGPTAAPRPAHAPRRHRLFCCIFVVNHSPWPCATSSGPLHTTAHPSPCRPPAGPRSAASHVLVLHVQSHHAKPLVRMSTRPPFGLAFSIRFVEMR